MAITVLEDVVLSDEIIAAGVRGRQIRNNSRVVTDNGAAFINVNWTQTLREFEIGIVPMSVRAWRAIESLHEITEGGAFGFLLEDPKDNRVTSGGVFTVDDDGFYQLIKRYTDPVSGRSKDRRITRPKGTILVYENGVLTAASVSPLDGRATIAGSPAVEDLTWTGSFYVPVHFIDDTIEWEVVRPGTEDSLLVRGASVLLQEIRE